jgi:hypothetical protein
MLRLNLMGLVVILWSVAAVADLGSSSNEELPKGPMQGKAMGSCSTCHEPRIIVQQRLTKAAWTREVDKMIKWGAEVNSQDRDALIDYFSTNFGPDSPPYVAPKTLSGPKTPTKAKR